ncbi:MAG: IS66 family insertion sequence element accessory protein TnpB [Clostridiales bacterium]|nr:IS66 family insertion sequence element accessory protein TnpB [Clostridiales bacterium]
MNTREVAAEYRMAQWTQTIQARVQSGQSIKEFCASAGISRNAYFYWQRKLREAACIGHMTVQNRENGLVPNGWTQLSETTPSTVTVGTLTVEVSGCHITATAETDLELLAKVCRALRSL